MFLRRVKFLIDWRECMRNEVKTFKKDVARELVEQGIADYAKPKKPKEKKFKKKKKGFKGAPTDKMLVGAPITK